MPRSSAETVAGAHRRCQDFVFVNAPHLRYKFHVSNEVQKPLVSAPRPVPTQFVTLPGPPMANIYANGFSLGFTNADTQLVLMLSGRPIAVVNFSYTLAKSISEKLGKLVEEWEKKTGHSLQTTESIDKAFATARPEEPK
jgi:hypothetical protein